jgi:hypothetical protein
VLFYQTQTTKRKVIFPAAYIKVVTESGDIEEYYSENSLTRKEFKEFIVTDKDKELISMLNLL